MGGINQQNGDAHIRFLIGLILDGFASSVTPSVCSWLDYFDLTWFVFVLLWLVAVALVG